MKRKEKTVTKAVIPIAGRGKRLMPFTLHQPKALIGVVDRPILHYVIDEAIAGGVDNIIFVISPYQRMPVEKYLEFLRADPEWESTSFDIAVQKEPLGNGHAVFSARRFVKGEPFLVLWSDDIIAPDPKSQPPMRTMIKFFESVGEPIIALEAVLRKDVHRYGVVKIEKTQAAKDFYKISDIVEKPSVAKAPSRLTVTGRYLITPPIMNNLKVLLEKKRFFKGEIWLTDALKMHLSKGNSLYGWKYSHTRFDCGSKAGLIKAQAYFGAHHKEFRKEFRKYLKTLHP